MVVRTTQLIGQEGAVLEVVVGLHNAHLEVVGDKQHIQLVVLEQLAGDEVEDAGGGLDPDGVVDDTRATAVLGAGLVHGVVGIQDAQDVGADADTEVAVGHVLVVLQLQGTLIQEGNELALQPLQVAIGEVGGSLEGEVGLVLMAGIQALHQTLVFHAGGDHGDVLGHRRHNVGVGEVLDAVGNIGPHLLGQADLDVRTGGHHVLVEVVAEGSVDRMGVLMVRHGGIEVDLLDAVVAAQPLHGAVIEIDAGRQIRVDNAAVILPDGEHAVHGVVLGIEVRIGALGDHDVFLGDGLAIQLHIDVRHAHIAVDLEQRVLTLHQRQVLDVQLNAVDQSIHIDLGTIHKGNGSVRGQSIDQVLFLGIAGSLQGRNDLFDLHRLLLQRTGIEQAVQGGLVGNAHGGRNGSSQSNQVGHQGRLGHGPIANQGALIDQVVLEQLFSTLGILLQHIVELLGEDGGVVIVHGALDRLSHVLDLNGSEDGPDGRLIADGRIAKLIDNLLNVAALIVTAKHARHIQSTLLSLLM